MNRMEGAGRLEDVGSRTDEGKSESAAANDFLKRLPRESTEQPEQVVLGAATEQRRPNSVVWEANPAKYLPPDELQLEAIGDRQQPFEDPREYLERVNPGWPEDLYRRDNCADCARAVERNWRGSEQVSAGVADRAGERPAVTEGWAGAKFRERDYDQIEEELLRGGHGSSAIVGFTRETGSGHAFNAVNLHGRILAVDGQSHRVGDWPPTYEVMGFDEGETKRIGSIVWGPDGSEIQ